MFLSGSSELWVSPHPLSDNYQTNNTITYNTKTKTDSYNNDSRLDNRRYNNDE